MAMLIMRIITSISDLPHPATPDVQLTLMDLVTASGIAFLGPRREYCGNTHSGGHWILRLLVGQGLSETKNELVKVDILLRYSREFSMYSCWQASMDLVTSVGLRGGWLSRVDNVSVGLGSFREVAS
jgi:hypothetical protein